MTVFPEASRAVTTSESVRVLFLAYRFFAAAVNPTLVVIVPATSVETDLPPPIWRDPSRIRAVTLQLSEHVARRVTPFRSSVRIFGEKLAATPRVGADVSAGAVPTAARARMAVLPPIRATSVAAPVVRLIRYSPDERLGET